VKIAPQHPATGFVLDGVQLQVLYGELGSTTHRGQLSVINGGILQFDLKSGVTLGMNMVVGLAGGGAGAGTVRLADSDAGYQIRHLTVTNDANITVHKDSSFYLSGKDGDGWILTPGITSGYIHVSGDFSRQGTGVIGSHLPFLVTGTGYLLVDPGSGDTTLNIDSSGLAATGDASLFVEAGGRVQVGVSAPAANVATLILQDDFALNGGTLYAFGNDAYVRANQVRFTNSASLNMLNEAYTNLRFELAGAGAKVQLTSGTWFYDIRGGGNTSDRVIVTGGTVDISTTGTTLSIEEQGVAEQGDSYFLIQALFSTITGAFDDFPDGFGPLIYSTGGGTIYELARIG
jgi:hypothetical protein